MPKMSGTFEHTYHLSHLISHARKKQRFLTVTLLDLRNAFGEVHHSLIKTVLEYHHLPNETSTLIQQLYTNFFTCITTDSYRTDFIHVGKGVLQGDCLNPLLFNLIINTFIQHVKNASYRQLGYQFSKYFQPPHWYQFADDAAVISGQQSENQVLLNAFTRWCSWADMLIRVDKCKTFGIEKVGSNAKQVPPKLYVNNNLIPTVGQGEHFVYLGRSFNYEMDNKSHQDQLVELTQDIMQRINILPLHPKNKIALYSRYLLPKLSWHLTIADLSKTWVIQSLDSLCNQYIRDWLEIPISGTMDIVSLPKSKFRLNIIPVSTKFTQCQATIRNCLKNSVNDDIRHIHEATSYGTNVQYDKYKTTREVLKDMRAATTDHITTKLTSQGFIIRAIWDAVMPEYKGLWLSTFDKMPRNIFNFCIRYLNNTLAANKNMFTWKKSASAQCSVCSAPQTLGHVIGGCAAHLNEGRYTWRHDSILKNLADYLRLKENLCVHADLERYSSPSVITGDDLRPDMVIIKGKLLYILELTVGFETNISKNAERKEQKYADLIENLQGRREQNKYEKVLFVNLSLGALGIIGKESHNLKIMLQELGLSKSEEDYIVKKLINVCIRCTYFLFCKKDSNWPETELLSW